MWNIDKKIIDVEISFDEPVFPSGVVCRLLHIPTWVLKQLDQEKIICPKRTKGRDRLYSRRELNRLNHIWYLMEKRKVTVNGVKVILEIENGSFKLE